MASGSNGTENILPFPKKQRNRESVNPAQAKIALETESLRDEARRTELAVKAEQSLDASRMVDAADIFPMSVNFYDFIYNLQSQHRLRVRDIAAKARGDHTPREVRALADYLPPKGIRTWSEFNAKYKNRRLATKPARYKELIVAAAELAGIDRRDAIIALVIGTKFEPRELDVEDEDIQPVREIASVLADIPLALDRVFPTKKYFDLLDRFQADPVASDSGIEFELQDFASDDRDIRCMPSIPFASRIVQTEEATLVVGESGDEDPDFQIQHDAGKVFSIEVTEMEHMALAIARLNGVVRPVGIISTTVEVKMPRGINIILTDGYLMHSYNFVEIETNGEIVAAVWQLKKQTANWRFDEKFTAGMGLINPEFSVRIIDYDYLLNDAAQWWHSKLQDEPRGFLQLDEWRFHLLGQRTRVSSKRALAGLFEMALSVDEQYSNMLSALVNKYTQMSDALKRCHEKEFGQIQNALETTRRRLKALGPELP